MLFNGISLFFFFSCLILVNIVVYRHSSITTYPSADVTHYLFFAFYFDIGHTFPGIDLLNFTFCTWCLVRSDGNAMHTDVFTQTTMPGIFVFVHLICRAIFNMNEYVRVIQKWNKNWYPRKRNNKIQRFYFPTKAYVRIICLWLPHWAFSHHSSDLHWSFLRSSYDIIMSSLSSDWINDEIMSMSIQNSLTLDVNLCHFIKKRTD